MQMPAILSARVGGILGSRADRGSSTFALRLVAVGFGQLFSLTFHTSVVNDVQCSDHFGALPAERFHLTFDQV